MRSLFGRRRRQSAYEYREGLRHTGGRPGVYVAVVLVAALLSANLAIFQAETAVHVSSKASVQPAQTKPLATQQPKLELAAQPAQPTPIGDNSRLDGIIASFTGSHSQYMWSVVVQGLGSDTISASYNPSQTYTAASIYKLLLIYPLSQKLPFGKWATTQLNVGGQSESVTDCVTAILKVSDNPCGTAIGNWVGWAYADSQLKNVGLANTKLNLAAGPITTSTDTANFLNELWGGNLVNSDVRQFVLGILSQQIDRDGIPAGCPGCNVADKVGFLGNVTHDAGIVTSGDKTYILSIFTSGAQWDKIAQLTAQVQSFMASN